MTETDKSKSQLKDKAVEYVGKEKMSPERKYDSWTGQR